MKRYLPWLLPAVLRRCGRAGLRSTGTTPGCSTAPAGRCCPARGAMRSPIPRSRSGRSSSCSTARSDAGRFRRARRRWPSCSYVRRRTRRGRATGGAGARRARRVVAGLTSSVFDSGHPANALLPLLWIIAASQARDGRTVHRGRDRRALCRLRDVGRSSASPCSRSRRDCARRVPAAVPSPPGSPPRCISPSSSSASSRWAHTAGTSPTCRCWPRRRPGNLVRLAAADRAGWLRARRRRSGRALRHGARRTLSGSFRSPSCSSGSCSTRWTAATTWSGSKPRRSSGSAAIAAWSARLPRVAREPVH